MKKSTIILIFSFLLVIVIAFFIFNNKSSIVGSVIEKNENFAISKVVFKGAEDKDIYGLFFIPNKKEFNVVIVLPGGGGTKESRRFYGEMLAEMGYGSLILDQRGIGETDGQIPSFADDLYAFSQKQGVHQILMALDVTNAVTFLDNIESVKNIAVLGESMGGQTAIIASAFDKRIKGAVVISSAGLFGAFGYEGADQYFAFINPNSYIKKISPDRLLMLHSINDDVISINDAKKTFSFANEPKTFIEFKEAECIHGYCAPMRPYIEDELKKDFS